MSLSIPPALQAAILASSTPHAILEFITIYHASFPGDHYYRFVKNPVDIVRGGNTYSALSFVVDRPVDKNGEIGDARLTLDAVDLSIINVIRSINTPAKVNIVVAVADSPDATPEINLGTFEYKQVTYNKSTLSGSLTYDDRFQFMVPSLSITPTNVSGSF